MRRCRANLPNRCRRQIDRVAHRAFEGWQAVNRECRAVMTRKTYCGNLLWQSSLTLLAPIWDPSEPVATRPLWMQRVSGTYNFFYFHDGNKNVSELVSYQAARGVPAHYEYAPFGAVTAVPLLQRICRRRTRTCLLQLPPLRADDGKVAKQGSEGRTDNARIV